MSDQCDEKLVRVKAALDDAQGTIRALDIKGSVLLGALLLATTNALFRLGEMFDRSAETASVGFWFLTLGTVLLTVGFFASAVLSMYCLRPRHNPGCVNGGIDRSVHHTPGWHSPTHVAGLLVKSGPPVELEAYLKELPQSADDWLKVLASEALKVGYIARIKGESMRLAYAWAMTALFGASLMLFGSLI